MRILIGFVAVYSILLHKFIGLFRRKPKKEEIPK